MKALFTFARNYAKHITKCKTLNIHKRYVEQCQKLEGIKKHRPPVVTILGHVDHGKTTLLDYLRNSQIVKQEFGGITQHIGAFVVPFKSKNTTQVVTFLDTPGHAAFSAMRQRGASVTDIAILVVACDDGVLDQTIESINYIKNSQVPMIVAINKIDKFKDPSQIEKNIEHIRKQLISHDVICEADGGDVQLVQISALRGIGIENLKESILILADIMDLTNEVDCPARGTIIESKVDPHKGQTCTLLVQKGRLLKGNYIIAGRNNWAKIRLLYDERGKIQNSCEPGFPIQVTGWREKELPFAGDPFAQVPSEKEAKSTIKDFYQARLIAKSENDLMAWKKKFDEYYVDYRKDLMERREKGFRYSQRSLMHRGYRQKESTVDENAFARTLNLVVRSDVHGSLDALVTIIDQYDKDGKQPVKLDLMKHEVGLISESDLLLASSFRNSTIYGFNTKVADQKIMNKAKAAGVPIKLFNVIYHLVDDLKERLSSLMPEIDVEIEIGKATVLQEFVINERKKKIHVAGCRCDKGQLLSDAMYRIERNGKIVANLWSTYTLKHLKADVKQIDKDMECGIAFVEGKDFVFKPGDKIKCIRMNKVKQKLKWNLKGFA